MNISRRVVGDLPTYLTFDVDGIDPTFAPGTGTPEIGGLTTREALKILRGLRGLDYVGGDVVEVSPPLDPTGTRALAFYRSFFESRMEFLRQIPWKTAKMGQRNAAGVRRRPPARIG